MRDENNCNNSITREVNVYPRPLADFYFTPKEPVESIDEVTFINSSQGAEKFDWSFSIINQSSQEKNPSLIFENTGTYAIALISQSDKGCLDTLVKSIFVLSDFTIFVPNIFSPNGDNLNESFKPIIRGSTQYRFQIFNRWGTKVFETQNTQAGWDGTFKGEPCKDDVYVWKIVVSNSKQEKILNGTVNVER